MSSGQVDSAGRHYAFVEYYVIWERRLRSVVGALLWVHPAMQAACRAMRVGAHALDLRSVGFAGQGCMYVISCFCNMSNGATGTNALATA